MFCFKLEFISPTWMLIKTKEKYFIDGSHDIDNKWIQEIRNDKKCKSKIVPRYLFDKWDYRDYSRLYQSDILISELIDIIINDVTKNNFDGLVLDSGYMGLRNHHKQIVFFLTTLAQKLHDLSKYLFFVVPALQGGESRPAFDSADLTELINEIDGFSLMTYDFSNSARPGPSSPLWWFEQNLNIIPENLHNTSKSKKSYILD